MERKCTLSYEISLSGKMLRVTLRDGSSRIWLPFEFTEYDIVKNFFVVIKDNQWVAMYALDQIEVVEFGV